MSYQRKKGSRGVRKYGRARTKCEQYRREHKREKNKIKKILRHLRKHPNDNRSRSHIKRLENFIKS